MAVDVSVILKVGFSVCADWLLKDWRGISIGWFLNTRPQFRRLLGCLNWDRFIRLVGLRSNLLIFAVVIIPCWLGLFMCGHGFATTIRSSVLELCSPCTLSWYLSWVTYWMTFIAYLRCCPFSNCQRKVSLHLACIANPDNTSAVMLVRAYAFTGRNKAVLSVLCVAYAVLLLAEIWGFGIDVTPSKFVERDYRLCKARHWGILYTDPITELNIGRSGCVRARGTGTFNTGIRTGVIYSVALTW